MVVPYCSAELVFSSVDALIVAESFLILVAVVWVIWGFVVSMVKWMFL